MTLSKNSYDMDNSTIISTVNKGICLGCGTCIAMCPKGAIKLVHDINKGIYLPKLNENLCTNCGTCLKVCPGMEIDFDGLNKEIFGSMNGDLILGNHIGCYIGNAADEKIRFDASSGGMITALLIFALEQGIIDGALVTRMKRDRPLEPEPFIAKTKKEIIQSSKSKYCPVPANIALRDIINSNKDERFAVVGIPCQINGIRKAEKFSNELREKIVLHFGIMCSHMDTFLATQFILNNLKIKAEEVEHLDYRGRGWPGSMYIKLRNGEEKIIPFKKYILPHKLWMFTPKYCDSCCDSLCQLSDISFGDAWNIKDASGDKIGTSLCISRTQLGDRILKKSAELNIIKIDKIISNRVIGSQGVLSVSRIRYSKSNIKKYRLMKNNIVSCNKINLNEKIFSPNLSDYAKCAIFNMNRKVMSFKSIWSISKLLIIIEEELIKLGKTIK